MPTSWALCKRKWTWIRTSKVNSQPHVALWLKEIEAAIACSGL